MTEVLNSSEIREVAVFYEATQGTPHVNAAAWAADEGTDTHRHRVTEFDPAFIRQAAVEDPDLVEHLAEQRDPIKGLKNADGGSMGTKLYGAEVATTLGSQMTRTALLRLLEHSLGGLVLGNTSVVDATVTNNLAYEIALPTNIDEGQIIAVEEAANPGRIYHQRVLSADGATPQAITLDTEVPFTIAPGDAVPAVGTVFIDVDALTTGGVNYSSVSVLIDVNGTVWQVSGGHFQCDTLTFPRGEAPRGQFSLLSAKAFPPGDGAPTSPVWTGTIQGGSGKAVGRLTQLNQAVYQTPANDCINIISATLNCGVPIEPLDTVTECDVNMEGRAGYRCGRVKPTFEIQAFLDTDHQDDWDLTSELTLKYEHQGPEGQSWVVYLPKAVLMEPPEPAMEGSKLHTLRYLCKRDDQIVTPTNEAMATSNFLIGIS